MTPEILNDIFDFVANGGSLITYCKDKDHKYSVLMKWIYGDDERQKKYEQALEARGEWVAQRLLLELQKVGFADIRKLFNDDGCIKDVSQLDDETAAIIGGIDIQDAVFNKDGDEVTPRTRKIKLVDKLRSIEMLGKHLKMFTEKHEITGKLTLEDLVKGSMQPDTEPVKEKPLDAVSAGEAEVIEKEKATTKEFEDGKDESKSQESDSKEEDGI